MIYSAVVCLALLTAQAMALQAAVTEYHPRIYVAPLPSILNTRTLTDYDVRRFFTQFGADPNGVWSNPIGESRDCPMLVAPESNAIHPSGCHECGSAIGLAALETAVARLAEVLQGLQSMLAIRWLSWSLLGLF